MAVGGRLRLIRRFWHRYFFRTLGLKIYSISCSSFSMEWYPHWCLATWSVSGRWVGRCWAWFCCRLIFESSFRHLSALFNYRNRRITTSSPRFCCSNQQTDTKASNRYFSLYMSNGISMIFWICLGVHWFDGRSWPEFDDQKQGRVHSEPRQVGISACSDNESSLREVRLVVDLDSRTL